MKELDRDALMQKARERAKREAEMRWPPGFQYAERRRREEDDLALRYFREYMGAQP